MSSKQPHSEPVLFLDRNLGKHVIAEALRSAGICVEVHDDHLPIDAPDEDWITLAGRNGWIVLTKDKNIRYRHAQLASIKKNATRIIVIRAKNTTGPEVAQMLLKGKNRIYRFHRSEDAPLVAAIYRDGRMKLYPL